MYRERERERETLGFEQKDEVRKTCLHFSMCACHRCAGAMLI